MAKINSKQKGSSNERECCKILNERFGEKLFARILSSGAWVGGKNRGNADVLTDEQTLAFCSDIICPVWFRYIIEHKAYADKATIWDFFNDSSNLNQWFSQVQGDADFAKKEPLLIVKYNNHKRIVFSHDRIDGYVFEYRGWFCYTLDKLLSLPDEFFKITYIK